MKTVVEQILTKLGVDYKATQGGKELNFNCISPTHSDIHASANINTDSGLWHCFSCLKSGNLKTFVRIVSGDDIDWQTMVTPKDSLKMKIGSIYQSSVKNILTYENDLDFSNKYEQESSNFVPAETNKMALEYLTGNKRKLSIQTIKMFNLQFSLDGDYENRIIIPYRVDGKIIGMNSRFVGDCDFSKRYRYLLNESRFGSYLYNLDRAKHNKYCILVEGPFDLMYLVQCGYTNVISTLNTRMSHGHMESLFRFKKIIFCFDNDVRTQAGRKAVMKHANSILTMVPDMPVYMVQLPDNTDANDCDLTQLQAGFSNLKRIKMKDQSEKVIDRLSLHLKQLL